MLITRKACVQIELLADDSADEDYFGYAVSLSGDTALIGAPYDDELEMYSGSAYVFVRNGTTWIQQAKLLPIAGKFYRGFGVSVSLSGDTALIGSLLDVDFPGSGAAHVFVRNGSTWSEQGKLVPEILTENDSFGSRVAVDGNIALVGASEDDVKGESSGAAYVYARNGTSWTQEAKLFPDDGAPLANFGNDVALSGSTAVVGAWADDTGSGYVFVREAGAWTQQAKLVASDVQSVDRLGAAVAISGDRVILMSMTSPPIYDGAAYVFARSGGTWSEELKLMPYEPTGASIDGVSVSLSGDAALFGVPLEMSGANTGAAYVGMLGKANGDPCVSETECAWGICTDGTCGPPIGTSCASGNECASGFCIDAVCCDSVCGNDDPNDCQACSVARGGAMDGTCSPHSACNVCRSAAGVCDAPEVCNGESLTCPEDAVAAAGVECRPAFGECDAAEACDGVSIDCPGDQFAPDGTICSAPQGICRDVVSPDGTGCGACYTGSCEPFRDDSNQSNGCGCRVVGADSNDSGIALFGLLGAALFRILERFRRDCGRPRSRKNARSSARQQALVD